jgi:phosphoglycerol transferase MdoB-like AlkP superfamily enzyme
MEIKHFFLLFKRISLLIVLFTLCRLVFYIFNLNYFKEADAWNLFLAFFLGLRFDLSIICMVNSLFIVLSILPFTFISKDGYQKFLKYLFLFSNIPLLIINLIDVELFKFRGKRSTYHILGMAGDIKDQFFQLIYHYWYMTLIAAIIIYLLIKLYPALNKKASYYLNHVWAFMAFLLILGFTFIVLRGSTGLKPLRPNAAFVLSPNILGNIALNTPFAFLTTIDIEGVQKVQYFKNDKDAINLITENRDYHFPSAKKENIVIIILESFASEFWGRSNTYKGYTPFLDSLSRKSVFIKNNFANGKTSMDAVPAILAGIPALMDESYITSIYQTNKINGLGSTLKKHGYNTSFFHGAKNGTMGFDVFVQNAGFDRYFGLNEYPDEKDFDGNWGVFDEPFLQFFCKEISKFPQPFLTSVFTISSHQPYTIPKKYKGKFPKGKLDIHETIGYTDYALREFFNSAKKQDWYKNTLFIITADHTQMHHEKEYFNVIGDFNVPLLLFHPGKILPSVDTAKISQHTDIMPTVLDYLNIKEEAQLLSGRSVFDHSPGLAINYSNNSYRLIHHDYFLEFIPGKGSNLYNFYEDRFQKTPISDKPEIKNRYNQELKAFIQYFNNGIIENNWYTLRNTK